MSDLVAQLEARVAQLEARLRMMGPRLARVVAVRPNTRSVDLVMQDTGMRIASAQVQTGHASTDSGSWNVPDVPKPTSENDPDTLAQSGRNLVAVVDFVGAVPIVRGFLHPARGEMAFNEQNRSIERHASGAYVTTAPDGSMELFHPSGAYFRIGTGAHQDLSTISADSNWSIPGGAASPQITLVTAGFSFTALPNGDTTLHSDHNVNVQGQNVNITATTTTMSGDLHVAGEVTAKYGTSGSVTLSQHHGHTTSSQPPTPGT